MKIIKKAIEKEMKKLNKMKEISIKNMNIPHLQLLYSQKLI
jgi:hypothetical protein